jgi:hypothetical protein
MWVMVLTPHHQWLAFCVHLIAGYLSRIAARSRLFRDHTPQVLSPAPRREKKKKFLHCFTFELNLLTA